MPCSGEYGPDLDGGLDADRAWRTFSLVTCGFSVELRGFETQMRPAEMPSELGLLCIGVVTRSGVFQGVCAGVLPDVTVLGSLPVCVATRSRREGRQRHMPPGMSA